VLFHNPKVQVFYASIQVGYPILHNLYKDVFVIASINSRKFATWKEVFESLYFLYKFVVANLALGLRPRQRFVKVWAKRSVRECEHEDSHSQVSSHVVATPLWPSVGVKPNTPEVGDLESSETSECSEFDSRGQNTSHWGVLGVIGKVLKCKCLKFPCIGHLDICSPSYGQKKGRESNWQFESRPLKVENRPLPDLRIESSRCLWKDLDEGYNFGSDLVTIRLGSWDL